MLATDRGSTESRSAAALHTELIARPPRLDLPDLTQHIVQHGNNRLPWVLDGADRLRYRQLLRSTLLTTECRLQAHVSMENHVPLLVAPPTAGAIAVLMQELGPARRPVQCPPSPHRHAVGRRVQGSSIDIGAFEAEPSKGDLNAPDLFTTCASTHETTRLVS